MALNEREREDLFRDAKTMTERAECVIDEVAVVVGFRAQGQLSVYCGSDPVFQFNADGDLRRVFYDGRRFAAKGGALFELVRTSRGGKVQFDSTAVDSQTHWSIVSLAIEWLRKLQEAAGDPAVKWRVAGDDQQKFRHRLIQFTEGRDEALGIARNPNA